MQTTAQSETKSVKAPKKPEQIAYEWWQYYSTDEHNAPSRKGEFANLRRCKTLQEIFFTAQYQNFYRRMVKTDWKSREANAIIAGVLAHVKTEVISDYADVASHFARPQDSGEKPVVSEFRFMRLMKIETHEELFPAMIRILHLAGDSAPVKDLIKSLYWWSDNTRREWVFNYFNKLPDKNK